MAKMTIQMPNDLELELSKLAKQSDDVIDKCLEAGAEVVLNAVRNNLREVLSPEHKNGELINALGITPAKIDRTGVHNVKVGFAEPRKKQPKTKNGKNKNRSYWEQTNAMIANVLEYGTKDGRQPARPFMQPAKKQSEKPALDAITRKFDEEVAKI